MKKRLIILLAILAICLAYYYNYLNSEIKNYKDHTGTVVDHQKTTCSEGETCWVPVISYVLPNGEKKYFLSNSRATYKTKVGKKVDIIVSPDYQTAYVSGIFGYWLPFTVLYTISLVIFLLTIVVFFWKKTEKR